MDNTWGIHHFQPFTHGVDVSIQAATKYPAGHSDVLIGAITTLIVVVAVYLSYNANNGLPFVPSYDINVRLPDAAGLIKGDGVTIGGDRVGYVSAITATRTASGRDIAVLHLTLERSIAPLPADSTDLVRPVSPLGLKYLEIRRGRLGIRRAL